MLNIVLLLKTQLYDQRQNFGNIFLKDLSDSFSVIIKIDENQCFCHLQKNLSHRFN